MSNNLDNLKVIKYRGDGFMTISKFNNNGDLLYIGDKDSKQIIVIDLSNLCILGSFNGHNGVIWSLDLSYDDNILVSCSGDLSLIFWNAKTGDLYKYIREESIPKYTSIQKFNKKNFVAVYCEAFTRKSKSYIKIYDLDLLNSDTDFKEIHNIDWIDSKITILSWLDESKLLIGCENGSIYIRDINNDRYLNEYKIHNDSIKSFNFNKTMTELLTSSLDCSSKIIDLNTWEVKQTFNSSCPINYAIYNFNNKKILLGGGVEAMLVAKTTDNDLNLKVYNIKSGKLVTHISSHFGPIRYLDQCKNNNIFTSASQDGTVKIYIYNELPDNMLYKYKPFGIALDKDIDELKLKDEPIKISHLLNSTVKEKTTDQKWIVGMPRPEKLITQDNIYKILESTKEHDVEVFTLKVSNLPNYIEISHILELFEYFGRIVDNSKIKYYNHDTIIFITYGYKEHSDRAIKELHKYKLDHSIIDVEYSKRVK